MPINNNDDALDENGLLKNGRSLRTSMLARDELTEVQRAIRDNKNILVVDAAGNAGLALQRPGFRCAPKPAADSREAGVAAAQTFERDQAYADAEKSRWDIPRKSYTVAEIGAIYDEVDAEAQDAWRAR